MISKLRHLVCPISCNLRTRLGYLSSTRKEELYIPIRPLKSDKNVLFTTGQPNDILFSLKLLIFTPFLSISLDGFINEWTSMRIAGSMIFFLYGIAIIDFINFYKAHQVCEMRTNQGLTNFSFLIKNNNHSLYFEEELLKYQNTSFVQKFKQHMANKMVEMPDELYTHLSKFKGKELERQIEKVRNIRDGIFFEVENKVIDKFELISKKQLKLLFKDHYFLVMGKKSKKVDIFEEYTTDKQKKDVLLVKTKNMKNGLPIYFFAEIDSNLDKKHEEYLKALGEGKKIVDIV